MAAAQLTEWSSRTQQRKSCRAGACGAKLTTERIVWRCDPALTRRGWKTETQTETSEAEELEMKGCRFSVASSPLPHAPRPHAVGDRCWGNEQAGCYCGLFLNQRLNSAPRAHTHTHTDALIISIEM